MFTFGFYDSKSGDRKYNSVQMSEIFDGIIGDGVYDSIGELMAVRPGEGMTVVVGTGRAWFNHTWNKNDGELILDISEADLLLDRFDAVVLEVDRRVTNRTNAIKVIEGTPSANPVKPKLLNGDGEVWQHPLAYIRVAKGVTSIDAAVIENTVGTSACPFVTGVVQTADIDVLFQQWDGEFSDWFENVKAQLTENVVTNLQYQIDRCVKVVNKATEADIAAGTKDKWVDAASVKVAVSSDNDPIGTVKICAENLEKKTGGKWVACDQRVWKRGEIPEEVFEMYRERIYENPIGIELEESEANKDLYRLVGTHDDNVQNRELNLDLALDDYELPSPTYTYYHRNAQNQDLPISMLKCYANIKDPARVILTPPGGEGYTAVTGTSSKNATVFMTTATNKSCLFKIDDVVYCFLTRTGGKESFWWNGTQYIYGNSSTAEEPLDGVVVRIDSKTGSILGIHSATLPLGASSYRWDGVHYCKKFDTICIAGRSNELLFSSDRLVHSSRVYLPGRRTGNGLGVYKISTVRNGGIFASIQEKDDVLYRAQQITLTNGSPYQISMNKSFDGGATWTEIILSSGSLNGYNISSSTACLWYVNNLNEICVLNEDATKYGLNRIYVDKFDASTGAFKTRKVIPWVNVPGAGYQSRDAGSDKWGSLSQSNVNGLCVLSDTKAILPFYLSIGIDKFQNPPGNWGSRPVVYDTEREEATVIPGLYSNGNYSGIMTLRNGLAIFPRTRPNTLTYDNERGRISTEPSAFTVGVYDYKTNRSVYLYGMTDNMSGLLVQKDSLLYVGTVTNHLLSANIIRAPYIPNGYIKIKN